MGESVRCQLTGRYLHLLNKTGIITLCKFLERGKTAIIPGSSMVEQEAVNFKVAGSSPAPGAIGLFRTIEVLGKPGAIYFRRKRRMKSAVSPRKLQVF